MYLIVPFIPGIVAIIIAVVTFFKRLKYKKVKANIMTREPARMEKSKNGKMVYIATYVYEYEGNRVEYKNEKLRTTADEWEYVYLNDAGEVVDNSNSRKKGFLIGGIIWIVVVYFYLKTTMLG